MASGLKSSLTPFSFLPALILCDERVDLQGLPGFLERLHQCRVVRFSGSNLGQLRPLINAEMLAFRAEVIARKRKTDGDKVWNFGRNALAIAGGVAGLDWLYRTLTKPERPKRRPSTNPNRKRARNMPSR